MGEKMKVSKRKFIKVVKQLIKNNGEYGILFKYINYEIENATQGIKDIYFKNDNEYQKKMLILLGKISTYKHIQGMIMMAFDTKQNIKDFKHSLLHIYYNLTSIENSNTTKETLYCFYENVDKIIGEKNA